MPRIEALLATAAIAALSGCEEPPPPPEADPGDVYTAVNQAKETAAAAEGTENTAPADPSP